MITFEITPSTDSLKGGIEKMSTRITIAISNDNSIAVCPSSLIINTPRTSLLKSSVILRKQKRRTFQFSAKKK